MNRMQQHQGAPATENVPTTEVVGAGVLELPIRFQLSTAARSFLLDEGELASLAVINYNSIYGTSVAERESLSSVYPRAIERVAAEVTARSTGSDILNVKEMLFDAVSELCQRPFIEPPHTEYLRALGRVHVYMQEHAEEVLGKFVVTTDQ
jgi:hypothetical protein